MADQQVARLRAAVRVRRLEAEMEALFAEVLEDVIGANALTAAITPSDLRALLGRWRREVKEKITPAMKKWYAQQWDIAAGLLPGELDLFLGPNVRDARAVEYVKQIENRLVGIGDTMYEKATDALRTSLETGEGVPKAAQRVAESLRVSAQRATVIARTEAAAAVNGADDSIARELHSNGVVTRKVWLATNDGRTRPDHAEADGQATDADGFFTVGGERLRYPGDPNGAADQVIQCRCTTLLQVAD